MERQFTKFIKDHFKDIPIKGAEVGVYTGSNALSILNYVPSIRTMYLIDPYVLYCEWSPLDLPVPPNVAKKVAITQTTPFKEKVKYIYSPFELISEIEDLDFIYIDGCHTYESVTQDCEKANTIVKAGVIGGHDYNFPSVILAVGDFCSKYKYAVHCGENEGAPGSFDWWIVK